MFGTSGCNNTSRATLFVPLDFSFYQMFPYSPIDHSANNSLP